MSPGCDADGDDGELFAEAGCGRERQRYAHERFDYEGREEPVLGPAGTGENLEAGLAVYRPHFDAWQRHLPAVECERECLPATGSALRGSESDQGFGGGSRVDDPD